jgi:hypothetical protein
MHCRASTCALCRPPRHLLPALTYRCTRVASSTPWCSPSTSCSVAWLSWTQRGSTWWRRVRAVRRREGTPMVTPRVGVPAQRRQVGMSHCLYHCPSPPLPSTPAPLPFLTNSTPSSKTRTHKLPVPRPFLNHASVSVACSVADRVRGQPVGATPLLQFLKLWRVGPGWRSLGCHRHAQGKQGGEHGPRSRVPLHPWRQRPRHQAATARVHADAVHADEDQAGCAHLGSPESKHRLRAAEVRAGGTCGCTTSAVCGPGTYGASLPCTQDQVDDDMLCRNNHHLSLHGPV